MEGGGGKQPDSQITRKQTEDLGACCSCFALILVFPFFANNVETKKRTLQTPGTLARIAWASTVWHWLDSPYYGRGGGRYASVQCPIYVVRMFMSRRSAKRSQTRIQ